MVAHGRNTQIFHLVLTNFITRPLNGIDLPGYRKKISNCKDEPSSPIFTFPFVNLVQRNNRSVISKARREFNAN